MFVVCSKEVSTKVRTVVSVDLHQLDRQKTQNLYFIKSSRFFNI